MEVQSFKLITRNIASSKRTERILEVLKREKPDLLLLQEVTLSTTELEFALQNTLYKCEANIDVGSPSLPGTAAVWRNNLHAPQVTSLVTCQLQSVQIGLQVFFKIYAPSGSANKHARGLLFTRDMVPHLLQPQNRMLPVLAGDWNCLLEAKDTTANFHAKFSKDLEQLVKTFKYFDAFRVLHPHTQEYTFHRASCAPSRLDRVYVPTNLKTKIGEVSHQQGLADHLGVCLILNIEIARLQLPPRPPRTHWKLNSSILLHEQFLPQFSSIFQELELEIDQFNDVADWWDEFAKPACTNFCKSFSSSLARQRKTFKTFLFALLRHATLKGDWTLVAQTKVKLNNIIKNEAYGLVVRSRDKQNMEEEAASLFHHAKVHKGNIDKLKVNEDGTLGYKRNAATVTSNDPERIENELVNFTDSLLNGRQDEHLQDTGTVFQPDYSNLDNFLGTLSQLCQVSQDALVEPLTEEEIKDVVKSCTNGKSPGLDGLTYEFFKTTWSIIGPSFTKVLQAQLDRSRLMESGRHGVTRLIPNVEGVPDVTQFRPITLLQTDYRLLSKCLAVRLHSVMKEVVNPGQLGTGDRNILTGVYNILSSIDIVNKQNKKAYLASWDAMKAYDRASIVYLDKVTEKMCFPQLFRSWLMMLHCGATTRLFLPSGLSKKIPVSFSFRQGDSIAGDCYCLTQEPLLRLIRERLSGLLVSNFNQKDEDYMDDVQFVSGDEQDLVIFNRTFREFEAQSGAMLSRDSKSKVMGLGQWEGRTDWPLTWIKTVKEMKVLGFLVCPQYADTLRCSWDSVFRGFQRTLFSWEKRALTTLQQRVKAAKVFALSKLWYVAQVLPLPPAMLKKIESALSLHIQGSP